MVFVGALWTSSKRSRILTAKPSYLIGLAIISTIVLVVMKESIDVEIIVRHGSTTPVTVLPSFVPDYKIALNAYRRYNKTTLQDNNFTAVIVLTYMRSGSSVTGDILQQNRDVFYIYEPFRMLYYIVRLRKPVLWFNGTISVHGTYNITEIMIQTLIGLMTCDFSMVYTQVFDDLVFLRFGLKTASYEQCIYDNKHSVRIRYANGDRSNKTYIRLSAFRRGLGEKCLKKLKQNCLNSKFRIIKTIRTTMRLADDVLSDVKECRVIHLIRDPRDSVISQARYQACPINGTSHSACAEEHCGKVWTDTLAKRDILSHASERILTVFYEHIASYPVIMSDIMHSFLGMDHSERNKQYARRITLGGNVTGCEVCQQIWQRGNQSQISTTYVNSWRGKVNPGVISQIQNICSNVMMYYGYEFYNTSHHEMT